MGKCPYCSKELHIKDFFVVIKRETNQGDITTELGKFKRESIIPLDSGSQSCKMWVCPFCDTILGFTEYGWKRAYPVLKHDI